jgi:hypothetical protein
MNPSIKGTVSLSTLQTAQCILYEPTTHRICNLPTYHKDHGSLLKKYYEAVDLQNYLSGKSGSGLHTLFVDYYIYYTYAKSGAIIKGGCVSDSSRVSIGALGTSNATSANHTAVSSVTLKDRNGVDALPFRILQHEWSHSYGIDFDPYNFSIGDLERCQGLCIMMGDYMNFSSAQNSVWCDRCNNIIQKNRNNW